MKGRTRAFAGLLLGVAAALWLAACDLGTTPAPTKEAAAADARVQPTATARIALPGAPAPTGPGAIYSPGGAAVPQLGMGYEGPFGFGREATKEEIDAWNIDVGPDGKGAPQQGRGTPVQGAPIFLNKCSSCHGAMGEGEEGFPTLVKPFDRSDLKFPQFPRTIGNYWPYATTVFDYVRRAMPFSAPNSLTPEEVYALTAWLLNKNGIIGDNDSIDAETLPKVQMPARKFFRPVWPQFFRP